MKWFNHDSAFEYFNTMDSTTVATVVFAFEEKISYIMVLDLSLQEPVIQILLHVLGRLKMAIYHTKR